MGKTNLDLSLSLKLLCTTRTAHPPRRRPASPSEKREERAGAALQATLNWAEGTRERGRGEEGGNEQFRRHYVRTFMDMSLGSTHFDHL
jgi:hypothetical protein